MRENDRMRRKGARAKDGEGISIKNALYIAGTILALGIIAFVITVMVYNNSLEKVYDDLGTRELGDLTSEKNEEEKTKTEAASSSIGKTIAEIENEIKQTAVENEEVRITAVETKEDKKETETLEKQESSVDIKNEEEEKEENNKKELAFSYPVEGEISREYAKDNLVYSETLKEWVTHTGIDIKADKTTVVKAAEEGTITAIKNDPRFGTTVIIEHSNGFETRYANLLTAEFVTVGEKVSKGQTIGTVGNTAAFEIMDDYHLHFELLKDGEYQDPSVYLK